MADDVFDDDDGIVNENADAEDEREQRDAVDGVAEEIKDRHGERERDRNGQQHHTRLAPAEKERNQEGDGERGQQQVLEQLVRFSFGGLAVVARSGDGNIVGDRLRPASRGRV